MYFDEFLQNLMAFLMCIIMIFVASFLVLAFIVAIRCAITGEKLEPHTSRYIIAYEKPKD
jgi:hypothetical protein